MGNINVNRTTADTQDNVRYSYNKHAGNIDYKGITIMVMGILAVLTAIWLIALVAANVGCYANGALECRESIIVFWSYLVILGISITIGLFFLIPNIVDMFSKIGFFEWRGVVTHKDDLRGIPVERGIFKKEKIEQNDNVQKIIAVAHRSAESEGTAGMDTFSPSFTNTNNSEETKSLPITDSKINDSHIGWATLLEIQNKETS